MNEPRVPGIGGLEVPVFAQTSGEALALWNI